MIKLSIILLLCGTGCFYKKDTEKQNVQLQGIVVNSQSNNDSLKKLAFPYTIGDFKSRVEEYLRLHDVAKDRIKRSIFLISFVIDKKTGLVSKVNYVFSEDEDKMVENKLTDFVLTFRPFNVSILPKKDKKIFSYFITLVFNETGNVDIDKVQIE